MGRGGGGVQFGVEKRKTAKIAARERRLPSSLLHPPVNLHWWHRPHYFPPSSSLHRSLPTRRRQRQNRGGEANSFPNRQKRFPPPSLSHSSAICTPLPSSSPSPVSLRATTQAHLSWKEGERKTWLCLQLFVPPSLLLRLLIAFPPYFLRSCLVAR